MRKKLSKDEILAHAEGMRRELARRHLLDFITYTFSDYEYGWFEREVCERLELFFERVCAGKNVNLMLFAPPRHGKTEIIARRFPAWVLGKRPDFQVLSGTNSEDLANATSHEVQDIVTSEEYEKIFPQVRLDIKRSDAFHIAGQRMRTTYKGCSVRSKIGGFGANILVLDDPIADRNVANSPAERESIWNWINSVFFRRLNPGGGGKLLMMTRFHPVDPAGRIIDSIDRGGEHWEVISYPAIAEVDEEHRDAGEALCPHRFPVKELDTIKADLISKDRDYEWLALYQQHPQETEGEAVFKPEVLKPYKDIAIQPQRGRIEQTSGDPSYNFVEDPGDMLRVWEQPIFGFSYMGAFDTAEGWTNALGDTDYHCFGILRRGITDGVLNTFKINPSVSIGEVHKPCIVAKWHGRDLDQDDYGRLIADLLRWYNWAYVLGERNSYGASVLQVLRKEYPKRLILVEETITKKQVDVKRDKLGIWTSVLNKPTLVDALKAVYRDQKWTDPDAEGLKEMSHFIRHDAKLCAESRFHDDEVAMRWLLCEGDRLAPMTMPYNLKVVPAHRQSGRRRAPVRRRA